MKTCPQCQVKYPDALEFCPRDGSPLPAAPGAAQDRGDPIIGTTIDGRYAIEARLGEGGMGVVYKAKHVLIDKPVAIKILRKEAAQDSASVQRFIQEAKSASKIGHSNIVDITDFGVLPDGHAYFVMEFLQGPTLAQALAEGPLDPARVCTIGAQMARGLHAAHQKGIVHRDLKPENIFLLEREGQKDFVKVVDFGIAKVGSGQRLTQVGMVLGTPEYMSPEQATGQDTDHRVDQYALGCMMYEMLTGVVPFLGERPAQTLTKHVFEAVQPPRQRKPELNIPVSLEAVIMRTLAKKAQERYPSMRELELALQQVESELRSGRVVVEDSRLLYSGQVPLATAQEAGLAAPQAAPTQAYPQQPYAPPSYAPAPSGSSAPAAYPAYPSYSSGVPVPAATVPSAPAVPAVSGYGPAATAPSAPPAASGYGPAASPSFVSSPAMAAYPSQPAPAAYPSQPGAQAYPAPYPSTPVATGYESGGVRPTRQTAKTSARRLGPFIAAAIGAVLVLGALAVYLFVIDKPQPAQPTPTPTPTPPVATPTPTPPVVAPTPTPAPPQEPARPPEPPARVQIMLRSSPSGANVYINGERAGQTPLALTKDRGASFLLELRKGGYQPLVKEVVASESQELPLSMLRKGEKRKRGREPKEPREVRDTPPQAQTPPPQGGGLRNPFGPKK